MRKSTWNRALQLVLAGILAAGLFLTGCGLKGPLYRPGEKQKKESSVPAPASSNKPPMSDRVPAPQSQKTEGAESPTSTDTAPTVDPDRPATPPSGTP